MDVVLKTLIIPSVRRKEVAFREKGFVSLGLTCLIDKVSVCSDSSRSSTNVLSMAAVRAELHPLLHEANIREPRGVED